ncbi:MAG: hypothetical protein Tsb002_29860 [Wenzhouxiangellaceae bacterium]
MKSPKTSRVVKPGTPLTEQRNALTDPSQLKVTLSPVTAVEGKKRAKMSSSCAWAVGNSAAAVKIPAAISLRK